MAGRTAAEREGGGGGDRGKREHSSLGGGEREREGSGQGTQGFLLNVGNAVHNQCVGNWDWEALPSNGSQNAVQ
jgi:hypothetical protein